MISSNSMPLIRIEHLSKHYDQPHKWKWFTTSRKPKIIRALDDVNLTVSKGETLGLVGESGCGKTTLGRLIVRLLEPTSGTIFFEGKDIFHLNNYQLQELRRSMQIIFQDNLSSLNPRKTIRKVLRQPYLTHNLVHKGVDVDYDADFRVKKLLKEVGLSPPELYMDRYPHELGGGQRQRVCIARAIALEPKFIVADEPVSSLDVTTRSQILNLMRELKKDHQLTYLFISHDLTVVKAVSNRVAVMYLGKIVEISNVQEIFERPFHPYTIALLSSILPPIPEKKQQLRQTNETEQVLLDTDVPYSIDIPSGCRFHTRCPYSYDKCRYAEPQLKEVNEGHFVACHLLEEN